jgi:Zn-dependent peptidase ImmA (M78 family)
MFTLAHEIVHVWFGSSAAFDLRQLQPARDETEQACNRVAAEFLVPEEDLREAWRNFESRQERFSDLALRFKVSEIVAARRALDLGLVTKSTFFSFYERYQDRWFNATHKKQAGGDFYATQNLRVGRRFAEAVVRATREGRLLYSEAFRLTGLYGKTFDRYAESLFGRVA